MNDTGIDAAVRTAVSDALGTPADELRVQPVLATHNWDSYTSLEVLSRLESELGITLDLRAYHEVRTVDELIHLVATVAAGPANGRR